MDRRDQKRLQDNLKALMRGQPGLAHRICLAMDEDHIGGDGPRTAHLELGGQRLPLGLDAGSRDEIMRGIPSGEHLRLMGAGDGELVGRLLERVGKGRLQVWERDPAVFRVLLASRDLRSSLASGRLTLHLAGDLVGLLEQPTQPTTLWHPTARRLYRLELRLVTEGGVAHPRAMVCTGGLFVDDLAEALRARGYSVLPLEAVKVSAEEVDHNIKLVAPELLSGINYVRGTEGLADRHGIPFLCWEIDPTTDRILPPEADSSCFHLNTYRRSAADGFQQAGFVHATYVPLAANPERRRPIEMTDEERATHGAPVSYVGSSMGNQARFFLQSYLKAYCAWRGGAEHLEEGKRLADLVLSAQRQDVMTYRVPELMDEHLGEFVAAMTAHNPRVDVTMWLGEISAMEKRLSLVASLGVHGAVVYGDPGWAPVVGRGVEHRGRVAHGTALTRVYCASDINVDIGRIYQSDIVTMRVFDVLACGGFLLAEHSPDLGDLFELGTELVTWTSPEDLHDKVKHYLAHPEERAEIARRGMEAVRARHTIQQRVDQMLDRIPLGDGVGERQA